jgi:hypothetical protein
VSLRTLTLSSLLLVGCVDPFAERTTTPAKYRGETRAAAASQPTDGSAGTGSKKSNGEAEEEPEQTYQEAWELICDAEKQAGVTPDTPRAERGAAVASWIVNHVTNKDARYWFIEFGNAKPELKEALFIAEVEKVGIEPCPLVELLFAPASESPDGAAPAPDAGTVEGDDERSK